VTKNTTGTKPTKPLTAAFATLAIVASMIALVPSARAADPTCDQFKSRLVEVGQALEQTGLSPPVIKYIQQMNGDPLHVLTVFAIPVAGAVDVDLYCRNDRFDSFDVLFWPSDFKTLLKFRYLMTAAIMAFTQWEAGAALKSLDKLVADVNANKDANIVLPSNAVIHLYGGGDTNFQINAADAVDGPSPGKE
jgi:hypothetical protein